LGIGDLGIGVWAQNPKPKPPKPNPKTQKPKNFLIFKIKKNNFLNNIILII